MIHIKSHTVQFMMRFWRPRVHSTENTALPLHTRLQHRKENSTTYQLDNIITLRQWSLTRVGQLLTLRQCWSINAVV